MNILAISSLVTFAAACTPDLLLDNFPSIKQERCIDCGLEPDNTYPIRYFNLVGGDYGAKDATISVNPNPAGGNMQLVSVWGPPDTSEADTHPGAPTAHNYWYVKFDQGACFDLSKYQSIQFGINAPSGTDFAISLTQKSADCKSRLIDSVYRNLTNYVITDGTTQTVTLPVADFSKNLLNQNFDLVHLKDFTLINLTPGNTIQLSNMVLKGDCPTTGTSSSPTGSSTSTETTQSPSSKTTSLPNNELIASPVYSLFMGLIGFLL